VSSSSKQVVFFKAEGSSQIGLGHISRCVALIRSLPSHLCGVLVVNDDPLVKKFVGELRIDSVYGWDKKALQRYQALALFYDHDDIEALHEIRKDFKKNIIALDYFNYETPEVDIIVNLFNQAQMPCPQTSPVSYNEGLNFAIISTRFEKFRNPNRAASAQIERVLLMMGGADPGQLTVKALKFLDSYEPTLSIEIVIGSLNPHESVVRDESLSSHHHVTIHKAPHNLPELMSQVDVAISGCATTFFELSFVGTPAIVLSQNKRERRFAESLEKEKVAIWGDEDLDKSWEKLISFENRTTLVKRQMEVFDGEGPLRILKVAGIIEDGKSISL
jgi:UDP-2,4-diacetamido-2,4,6-trideoxy-beta-L-altropyranose hydrolase